MISSLQYEYDHCTFIIQSMRGIFRGSCSCESCDFFLRLIDCRDYDAHCRFVHFFADLHIRDVGVATSKNQAIA